MNSVHNQLTSLGSRAFIDVVPWGVKPMDPAYGCSWMLSIGFSSRCAAPRAFLLIVPPLPGCPAPDGRRQEHRAQVRQQTCRRTCLFFKKKSNAFIQRLDK